MSSIFKQQGLVGDVCLVKLRKVSESVHFWHAALGGCCNFVCKTKTRFNLYAFFVLLLVSKIS